MRKLVTGIAAAVLVLGLAACNNKASEKTSTSTETTEAAPRWTRRRRRRPSTSATRRSPRPTHSDDDRNDLGGRRFQRHQRDQREVIKGRPAALCRRPPILSPPGIATCGGYLRRAQAGPLAGGSASRRARIAPRWPPAADHLTRTARLRPHRQTSNRAFRRLPRARALLSQSAPPSRPGLSGRCQGLTQGVGRRSMRRRAQSWPHWARWRCCRRVRGPTCWKSIPAAPTGPREAHRRQDGDERPARRGAGRSGRCPGRSRAQRPNHPAAYAAKVQELAARYDLSPALIEAVVWQESRWHPPARVARRRARSRPADAGHRPAARASTPTIRWPTSKAAHATCAQQLDRFGGDLEKALAAYNAGPGRVPSAGGVPRIRETQTYVASVMGRLADMPGDDDNA